MSDLRVAVLGLGMMGAFHVDCSPPRSRAPRSPWSTTSCRRRPTEVAARIGARVVADPIEAINDPEVDAVLLARRAAPTPSRCRHAWTGHPGAVREAADHRRRDSSYRLVQQEAALGRTLDAGGFMRRFDAEYVALRELIASGGRRATSCSCTAPTAIRRCRDHFNSEFMIRDSVVHEVDVARFLLDEEIASVQVLAGAATSAAPAGTRDPMLVVFETESGRLVTDECFVRTGVAYEVRTEAVGEAGSAP